MGTEEDKEERTRKLTEKGSGQYNDRNAFYRNKTEKAWDDVQNILESLCEADGSTVDIMESDLHKHYDHYVSVCSDYIEFLKGTRTDESDNELCLLEKTFSNCGRMFKSALTQIKIIRNADAKSIANTTADSSASRETKVQIKLEKIKAKVKLAEEEDGIQKQLAEIRHKTEEEKLKAELNVISLKKEAIELEAEARASSIGVDRDNSPPPPVLLPTEKSRTERFVAEHFHNPSFHPIQYGPNSPYIRSDPCDPCDPDPFPRHTPNNNNSVASELTSFLLKKDLLMTRLTVFDEKPEHYSSWKVNFKEIMHDLKVNPSEELDLLIRWLGPDSSRHAKTIRTSIGSDPRWGVEKIWDRLDERFGAPEMVEASIKNKLNSFPRLGNKDNKKLYELVDIMIEIEALMGNPRYSMLLAYFNTSSGVSPIINKLPYNLQEKWTMRAANYKKQHDVPYPPFSFVLDFVKEMSKIRNDPAFFQTFETHTSKSNAFSYSTGNQKPVIARKTDVKANVSYSPDKMCPVHMKQHSLNQCREFSQWDIKKRRDFLKRKGICYKCCASTTHLMRDCKQSEECTKCRSHQHPTALHMEGRNATEPFCSRTLKDSAEVKTSHGGEKAKEVVASCTSLCGEEFNGRSCSKTVLVKVYLEKEPERTITTYALLDEHSNRTLASSELLDQLSVEGFQAAYTLSTCAGTEQKTGRRATGIMVKSMDGISRHTLPTVIECNDIPNNISEIPTPEVARAHPHLRQIACQLYPLDPKAKVQLLIGRDLLEVHHVQHQITGPHGAPFAQRLSLGWVIVGEVCIGKFHRDNISVLKTNLLVNGRSTIFNPCDSKLVVREHPVEPSIGETLFVKTQNDEKIGMSYEDLKFTELMDSTFRKDSSGVWMAPLPFKSERARLPNNRPQVLQRAQQLESNLKRNPEKLNHLITFMDKVFRSQAAERAPVLQDDEKERWYLPIFGVYHPKKPNQIRGVFDSSVVYKGLSLNNVLLTGPNLTNSLLGVLLRFRKDECAITADIEQMFYRFFVIPEHRDFLRFFWFEDNDPNSPMVEYRMTVHVFGNRPSPAIATYGLRKAVQEADVDVREFINCNFYVDDALKSTTLPEAAVSLLERTKRVLQNEGHIRLHKIASNNKSVMSQFSKEDLGKDLKDLDLSDDALPLQQSLGLSWDLNTDNFVFTAPKLNSSFTRRGLLSAVSSIFDPIGFLAPFTVNGRMLLRETCPQGFDWDDQLPETHQKRWQNWMDDLNLLDGFQIPRMYVPSSYSQMKVREVAIFSDASEKAVAAAAYLKTMDDQGQQRLGFIMGKSKLAPSAGNSIPRLELCGAVLATEIGQFLAEQLEIPQTKMRYFVDSKVVLGYIKNDTRRFYTYVSNRVARIRHITSPEQWNYVPTHLNPADVATRGVSQDILTAIQTWLKGPEYILKNKETSEDEPETFPLIEPDSDKEIRSVQVLQTTVSTYLPLDERFSRFSTWKGLINAIAILKHNARCHIKGIDSSCKGWHWCQEATVPVTLKEAEKFVIKTVQQKHYYKEINNLRLGLSLNKGSHIISLSPYLDEDGLLRVGGRLNRLRDSLGLASTNPIIIPKGVVATLLVKHFHEKTFHQGRKFTEGKIRSNGFWIIGAKRIITSLIGKCVLCQKLRGKMLEQKMSDLPTDRLVPGPPFTAVGVDTFGPWDITTRKTRGGVAQSKRWAVIFTCLTTRAVHIELIEEMSSSSFINALRRVTAVRGPIKIYRSDRGTNFVGATDQIGINSINVEDAQLKSHLNNSGSVWIFNAPHSSHMGGVWERMIGVTRRILDGILVQQKAKTLTHEILSTLMAEVSAVINSRPISAISSDPETPLILSPNILLTQKQGEDSLMFSEQLSLKDVYRADWKHVQVLSDLFWRKWKDTYLNELQQRRKWHDKKPNVKRGDVVLVKDASLVRYQWPIGVVEEAIKSDDQLVLKAVIRVHRDGKYVLYTRPINELVLLLDD